MAGPYQPIGFCPTCGYRMDAGTCPECGEICDEAAKFTEIPTSEWLPPAIWICSLLLLMFVIVGLVRWMSMPLIHWLWTQLA